MVKALPELSQAPQTAERQVLRLVPRPVLLRRLPQAVALRAGQPLVLRLVLRPGPQLVRRRVLQGLLVLRPRWARLREPPQVLPPLPLPVGPAAMPVQSPVATMGMAMATEMEGMETAVGMGADPACCRLDKSR